MVEDQKTMPYFGVRFCAELLLACQHNQLNLHKNIKPLWFVHGEIDKLIPFDNIER